jgi:hypothetical protein
MRVVVCKLSLFFPGSHSLKEKRHFLGKIKGSVLSKFHVMIAEVNHQDLWQRSELGFAVVGNDEGKLKTVEEGIVRHLEGLDGGQITDRDLQVVVV